MPDFAAWRDDTQARAQAAWARITEHGVDITIRRGDASEGSHMLDAQIVRIELGDSAREDLDLRRGLNIVPAVQRAVVFGVKNHPTVPDTNIQRGDRFVVGTTEYEVIGVVSVLGQVQAFCEART